VQREGEGRRDAGVEVEGYAIRDQRAGMEGGRRRDLGFRDGEARSKGRTEALGWR
jgi:hypothetical protein